MIDVKRIAAQGDVLFRRVAKVPAGWIAQASAGPEIVVAHSETGHHHVVKLEGAALQAQLFVSPADPLLSYLKLPTGSPAPEVEHRRPFDTHQTLRLLTRESRGETIFEIRRQREWAPEGWRRVED